MRKLNHTPGPWTLVGDFMLFGSGGIKIADIYSARADDRFLLRHAAEMYSLLLRAASGLLIEEEARQLIAELEGE